MLAGAEAAAAFRTLRVGRHCPTSPPSLPAPAKRVSWAGLRKGAAHRLCCRNWPDRPGRARPRPRGWKQRGLGAGEEAELSGDPARRWLGLCRGGEGRGGRPELRGGRLSSAVVGSVALRVSPAHAAQSTAPAQPARIRERREGVQWGGRGGPGGGAPRAACRRASGGRGGWDAGQKRWGLRGASWLLQRRAWSRGFLERPV